jgi:hypothetical protein
MNTILSKTCIISYWSRCLKMDSWSKLEKISLRIVCISGLVASFCEEENYIFCQKFLEKLTNA